MLITDGAENGGTLSEERLAQLTSYGVPVHTVGVGPEQIENDLELDSVTLADSAAPGEVLGAEVSIRHSAKGKTRLRVYDGDKLLAANDVTLTADAGVTTQTIAVPAGDAGVRDLRFTLDPLPGERNTINNSRTHVMDVTPQRRNILYIEGEPRWEYSSSGARRRRITRCDSRASCAPRRIVITGKASSRAMSSPRVFPLTAEELFRFDAGHRQFRSDGAQRRAAGDPQELRGSARRRTADARRSRWSFRRRLGLVPIAQTLPAQLPATDTKSFALTTAKAVLTDYGAESPITRLDDDPTKNIAAWNSLPPFGDLQPLGKLKPGAVVLLNAKANNRESPLLVWQHYGRGATYLLATGSTWRWKMRLPHDDQRHYHVLAPASPCAGRRMRPLASR